MAYLYKKSLVTTEHPVIDGHNDFPMGVRDVLQVYTFF